MCVCVFMCVCLCVCVYTYTHTHTHTSHTRITRQGNGMSSSVVFPGWQSSLRATEGDHLHSKTANCFVSAVSKEYPASGSAAPEPAGVSLAAHELGHELSHELLQIGESGGASDVAFSTFTYSIRVQRPVYQGIITHFVPPAIMLAPTLCSYLIDPVAHWATRHLLFKSLNLWWLHSGNILLGLTFENGR